LYAKANPLPGARAKVPLLQDGSAVFCESLVVAEYIAEQYCNDLLPPTAQERAIMRLFTELCGSSFSYFPLLRQKDEKLDAAVESFKDGLINVDTFLSKLGNNKGPFLFGSRFSLAECNAAPFVQRACTILPAFTGGAKPINPIEICEDLGLTRLKQWIEAVLSRQSVVATGVAKEDMVKSTTKMLERFAAMDEQ
jgi:glutathione S-transferase